MKAGGTRQGAGRPKAAPTKVYRLRLPLADAAAIDALGADKWLKQVINDALKAKAELAK
jgi:hypothetical protein